MNKLREFWNWLWQKGRCYQVVWYRENVKEVEPTRYFSKKSAEDRAFWLFVGGKGINKVEVVAGDFKDKELTEVCETYKDHRYE